MSSLNPGVTACLDLLDRDRGKFKKNVSEAIQELVEKTSRNQCVALVLSVYAPSEAAGTAWVIRALKLTGTV